MPDGCPGRWAHLETLLSRRQCTLNLRTTVTVDWRCLELSLVVITPSCNKVKDWPLSYILHVSFLKYIPANFLRVNGGRSRRVRALGFFVKDPTYSSLKVPEDVHSFSVPLLSLLNNSHGFFLNIGPSLSFLYSFKKAQLFAKRENEDFSL